MSSFTDQLRQSSSTLVTTLRSGVFPEPPQPEIDQQTKAEIDALAQKHPIEKVLRAIDSHPDMQQKDLAKQYAQSLQKKPDYKQHIATATSMYPKVSANLLDTTYQMESSRGKDTRNKNLDAGDYGYLMGITKTGRFADMVKNKDAVKKPYKVFENNPESVGIKKPEHAMQVAASIFAQHIENDLGGKAPQNAQEALSLYEKYYKTGQPMTEERKKQFIKAYNSYKDKP